MLLKDCDTIGRGAGWAATLAAILWGGQSLAQTAPATSETELSKDSLDPVTRQITLPLRYEGTLNDGVDKKTKSTVELDNGIVPFQLTNDWALITRTKLPFIVQPPKKKGDHWESGLSNGYTTFFLSPSSGHGFYWGAGPLLYYPSVTNSAVGVHRWGSGPSVAFVKKDESPWEFGAVVNNIWTFGSNADTSNSTYSFLLNPFVSYHFDDGWSVGSSPNITANWIASGGKWTVPVGGGVGKVVRVAGQPLKLAVEAYYNAIRPKAGNDQTVIQFTVTFLFPK